LRRIHDLKALLDEAVQYAPDLEGCRSFCERVTTYYLIEWYPYAMHVGLTQVEIANGLRSARELVAKVGESLPDSLLTHPHPVKQELPGVTGVLSKMLTEQLGPPGQLPRIRRLLAGEIPLDQGPTNPPVYWKCFQLIQGKEGNAVGNLVADARTLQQPILGRVVRHLQQSIQVQGTFRYFYGGPVYVRGAL
jgi:hypothetical protein